MHYEDPLPEFSPSFKVAAAFAAAAVALAAVTGSLDDGRAAAVTDGMVKEACAVTVAQYGPGERWVSPSPSPACAGAVVPAPSYVMSSPLPESK